MFIRYYVTGMDITESYTDIFDFPYIIDIFFLSFVLQNGIIKIVKLYFSSSSIFEYNNQDESLL